MFELCSSDPVENIIRLSVCHGDLSLIRKTVWQVL